MAHRCWIFLSMLALAPACDTSRETSPGPAVVTFSFRNTCDSAPTAAISLFVGTTESTHVAFAGNWVVRLGETITVQVPSGTYQWEGAIVTDYTVALAYSHWSPVVYDIAASGPDTYTVYSFHDQISDAQCSLYPGQRVS